MLHPIDSIQETQVDAIFNPQIVSGAASCHRHSVGNFYHHSLGEG
jgi:hypothetical protein